MCLPLTTAAKSLSIELDDGFIDDSRYSMLLLFAVLYGFLFKAFYIWIPVQVEIKNVSYFIRLSPFFSSSFFLLLFFVCFLCCCCICLFAYPWWLPLMCKICAAALLMLMLPLLLLYVRCNFGFACALPLSRCLFTHSQSVLICLRCCCSIPNKCIMPSVFFGCHELCYSNYVRIHWCET